MHVDPTLMIAFAALLHALTTIVTRSPLPSGIPRSCAMSCNLRVTNSKSLKQLARPERFELPTPRFVVWCSIQLSYGRAGPLKGCESES
jgi:hypothetical protein